MAPIGLHPGAGPAGDARGILTGSHPKAHPLRFLNLILASIGLLCLSSPSWSQTGAPVTQLDPVRKVSAFDIEGSVPTELWIAAGQSQMLGVNFGRDASPGGPDRLPENVMVLDTSNQIVPWHVPFETPAGSLEGTYENVSPALTFLKTRAEAYPNRRFLLVFVVRGASGFTVANLPDQNWAAPTSGFYTPGNLTDLLLERIAFLRNRGYEPSGVLWLQGEADTPAGPSIYSSEFTQFRLAIRDAAANPELPFFLGGIARFEWTIFPGGDLIDLALLGLAAGDQFSWFVTTEDMIPQPDGLHYDDTSTRVLGERYASIVELEAPPILPVLVNEVQLPGGLVASPPGTILVQKVGPRGKGIFDSYDPAASALDRFESYRRSDGSFHLEISWANGERVRWRQTTNPFRVDRDVVLGFSYLPDSPITYPPDQFGGLCRTAASGLILSVQPGRASLFTSGLGLYRFGALNELIGFGVTDLFWTPGGVLVDSARLRSL